MKSFNVVIATIGRDTLQRMIDSISLQLTSDDYITIIWDCAPVELSFSGDHAVVHIVNPDPLGFWGHASRTKWQKYLFGDYIMNADDDDVYYPEAMEKVRSCVKEHKLYMFKMSYGENVLWRYPSIEIANIGTPCGVYPNHIELPEWTLKYGGDFEFYNELSKTIEVQFCDHVIYKVKNA